MVINDYLLDLQVDPTQGDYGDPWNCPIAEALKKVLKPGLVPLIGRNDYDIKDEDGTKLVNNHPMPEFGYDDYLEKLGKGDTFTHSILINPGFLKNRK